MDQDQIGVARAEPDYLDWLRRGWQVNLPTYGGVYHLEPFVGHLRVSKVLQSGREEFVCEGVRWKEIKCASGHYHLTVYPLDEPPFRLSPQRPDQSPTTPNL